jgi:hypothetical protein
LCACCRQLDRTSINPACACSKTFSPLQVMSELASVNIRLFPFAAALAKRGHTTFVSDPDHFHQVSSPRVCSVSYPFTFTCIQLHEDCTSVQWGICKLRGPQ